MKSQCAYNTHTAGGWKCSKSFGKVCLILTSTFKRPSFRPNPKKTSPMPVTSLKNYRGLNNNTTEAMYRNAWNSYNGKPESCIENPFIQQPTHPPTCPIAPILHILPMLPIANPTCRKLNSSGTRTSSGLSFKEINCILYYLHYHSDHNLSSGGFIPYQGQLNQTPRASFCQWLSTLPSKARRGSAPGSSEPSDQADLLGCSGDLGKYRDP